MKPRRMVSVLLGVVLAILALSPPAAAVTTIQLTGTVTNTDGVSQNGTVCLELVGSGTCGGNSLTAGSWSSTWNDVDDTAGDYLVRVISSTMDGTSRWYVAGDNAGTTNKALATPVHLAVGEADFSFTMVMPAIATVTGRVIGTDAIGVPGLHVLINEGGMVRQTTTDATGHYDLGYTRAGSFQVFANGGTTYAGAQTGVLVPASGAVVVNDMVVQLPAHISGQVTDSVTGDPIPFIEVYAWSAADPRTYLGSALTDATGHYLIDGLGNTPLVLRFTDAALSGYERTLNDGGDPVDWSPQTPITLTESEAHHYDQALARVSPVVPPTHNLSGTVTDTGGHPLAGIDVTFGDVVAVTDRLGHWYIDAPDGTHPLGFAADSYWSEAFPSESGWAAESYPGRLVSSTATPVTVTGGTGQDNLDITLVRALTNTALPVVTGVAAAGHTLTATQGTWLVHAGTTFSITWLRGNVAVATGATYLVKPADAGRNLHVRVTAFDGVSTSPARSLPRTIHRLATTTTARGTSPRSGKVRIKARVSALGLTPAGKVVVRRGSKVVQRGVALADGRAVIVLGRQPSGAQRYSVTFKGAVATLPSRSPKFKVTVRER